MVAETKTKQSPIPSYVIARIVCHRRPDNGPTVYHAVPCLLPFQDTHPSPAQRASTTLVGHTEGGEGQKRVYRGRRDIKFENNPRRDLIRSRVICNRISSSRHDSSPISIPRFEDRFSSSSSSVRFSRAPTFDCCLDSPSFPFDLTLVSPFRTGHK